EAAAERLTCASCRPDRARPDAGGALIDYPAEIGGLTRSSYLQRNVSGAGQVFFETDEALLPQDTNGRRDVYEREGGALHLISSGTSESDSFFVDATPSGSDVFFATAQALVRGDTDAAYDIYDARADGGFAEPPPPAPECESEECRGTSTTGGAFAAIGTASFSGPGDLSPTIDHRVKPKAHRPKRKLSSRCARRHSHDGRQRRTCRRDRKGAR
ncbi:MAG: hypothetical protein FWD42_06275, partial [Solirubrobacterales bacterium]|nr:hypothetical protein [Solirubrobacterales bacterium]